MFERDFNKEFDSISIINIHNVYGRPETIDNAIAKLKISKADLCISARIERAPILRFAEHGLEIVGLGRHNSLFSHEQEILRYSGGVICFIPSTAQFDNPWRTKIVHVEPYANEDFILTADTYK